MQDVRHQPDHAEITERQRKVWATGDFNEIARHTMAISEALCCAIDPHAGQRVLDVACGSGNTALIAARRYCDVAGVDCVPELIARARARAAADGVSVDFRVGDAQRLPFADASFDVVLSVLGVMFAPDQERAARELLRVCRPGGVIGLASWMPEGFGGDFFGAHARHVPPSPGLAPPVRWGTEEGLDDLLGDAATSIKSERCATFAYFRSIEHAVGVHRRFFGPTRRAFEVVDPGSRQGLARDIEAVFRRHNGAADGTAVIEYEHLQTILSRS